MQPKEIKLEKAKLAHIYICKIVLNLLINYDFSRKYITDYIYAFDKLLVDIYP